MCVVPCRAVSYRTVLHRTVSCRVCVYVCVCVVWFSACFLRGRARTETNGVQQVAGGWFCHRNQQHAATRNQCEKFIRGGALVWGICVDNVAREDALHTLAFSQCQTA